MPSPTSRSNTVDVLVELIREDIMNGALGPGQRIDQDAWAERVSASRTPVRLALERLESQGFVKLLPRRGAIITEMTMTYVEDVLATRLVLEAALGRAGARNLDKEARDALRAIGKEIEAITLPEDHAQMVDPAHRFHFRLYQAAQAPMMEKLAQQVVDHTRLFLNRLWYADRRIAQVGKIYFAELFKACDTGDLDRVELLIRNQRVDMAGVILQGRYRVDDLKTLPGVLTGQELLRLGAITDSGQDPVGPTVEEPASSIR